MIHASLVAQHFTEWQASEDLHPFTCGGGGGPCSGVHLHLGEVRADSLDFRCPGCGRVQTTVRGDVLWTLLTSEVNEDG